MIPRVLGLFILLHAIQQVCAAFRLLDLYQWMIWDSLHVTSQAVVSFVLFKVISYRSPKSKLVSFIYMLVCMWSAISFFILNAFEEYLLVFTLCFFISIIPFFFWAALRDYELRSDKYSTSCSYLVYNQPASVVGLVALCVGFRGASVSLVVDGREFSYTRVDDTWRISEREHRYQLAGRKYQKIKDVGLENARELVGKEWHWRKNCLSTFVKYQDRKCPFWWA